MSDSIQYGELPKAYAIAPVNGSLSVAEFIAAQDLLAYDLWSSTNGTWTMIKAMNWHGELETYKVHGFIAENPGMYAAIVYATKNKLWTWHEIWTSEQDKENAKKLTIGSKPELKPIVKVLKRNREHERAFIILHEEITVTCEETGISWIAKLPTPTSLNNKLNLAVLHPLAFADNVQKLMQNYSKSGLRIESELETQVLAGMFISILRSKGLLLCKDAPKANMFLQAATKETLGFACRWFYGRSSTVNMPALALYLEDDRQVRNILKEVKTLNEQQKATQQADLFILNYVKACKGESTLDEAAHIHIKPKAKAKGIKLYSDPLVKQVKAADDAEKRGAYLLAQLVSLYPGQHNLVFDRIKQTLKILAFASQKLRADIAQKLRDNFPVNEEAKELAVIFAGIQQGAIEDDLFSFTQQLATEIEAKTGKPVKVDFLSKLKQQSKE